MTALSPLRGLPVHVVQLVNMDSTDQSRFSLDQQRASWNTWLEKTNRADNAHDVSLRQWETIRHWLGTRRQLRILDVGCGDGWLVSRLLPYGSVTGTDLADEVIERAKARYPAATFVAGDFMSLEYPTRSFDVVVSCEVLSHVADQPAFLRKAVSLVAPGGELLLATQNKWALDRNEKLGTPTGYLRKWVTRADLQEMLEPMAEVVEMFTVGPFEGHRGALRIANSPKLTLLAQAVLGHALVDRIKGGLGMGWTIMVRARPR
jgi:2-polyprenyl-3-methyl-5-hydroxy-6-metoxy-1,4-benzoquinol methylase